MAVLYDVIEYLKTSYYVNFTEIALAQSFEAEPTK